MHINKKININKKSRSIKGLKSSDLNASKNQIRIKCLYNTLDFSKNYLISPCCDGFQGQSIIINVLYNFHY